MTATSSEATVRDEIFRAIAGQTLVSRFSQTLQARPQAVAIRWRAADQATFHDWTWARYADEACRFAAALHGSGLERGDSVLLRLRNRAEFHSSDMGTLIAGGVTATASIGSAPEQVRYLAEHSKAGVVVFDDPRACEAFAATRSELPSLRRIVFLGDPSEIPAGAIAYAEFIDVAPLDLDAATRGIRPSDPLNLIYTSGTTGAPKAVQTNHANICWWAESVRRVLGDYDLVGRRMISYLPMEIMSVRLLNQYTHAIRGTEITTCPDPLQLADYMRAVRPQVFLGVPRTWEKIYSSLRAGLAADPGREKLFEDALAVGREVEAMRSSDRALSAELEARWQTVDARLFRPIRESIGLDQCDIALSGTAPIPQAIVEFLLAIGLPLSESYGLAEATAITFEPFRRRAGTVGRPIPGCEIRLLPDQEILIRSGNRFQEYFKDPEATAAVVDSEGWFYTGDIGSVDSDGYVRITGRKKELIITSEGRNISPSNVEAALRGSSPLIGQCCVVGDDRPFVIALLSLDPSVLPAWARAQGIAGDLVSLAADVRVRREVQRCVDLVNTKLSAHERVHRFVLIAEEWKPGTDVMSSSLKLLRQGIHRRYAAEIEASYSDVISSSLLE